MSAEPLCPRAQGRAVMTDDDFWADVATGLGHPQDLEPDEDDLRDQHDGLDLAVPCPLCAAPGACGYDNEGRPLIHADDEVDV